MADQESNAPVELPSTPANEGEGGPNRNLIALGILVLAAAIAAVVLAVTGGDDGGGNAGEGGGASAGGAALEGCQDAALPEPKEVSLSAPENLEPVDGSAVVATSCGTFTIALDTDRAPITVASFENLVNEGVYDGTTFHRIVPGFVIQGGDPAGNGTGGPGYSVDEAPPDDLVYSQGIVAMAKSDAEPPGRSGSQFFVVLSADAGLPPDFALVGEVSEGFDVVEAIAGLGDPASPDGTPTAPVLIEQITLEAS